MTPERKCYSPRIQTLIYLIYRSYMKVLDALHVELSPLSREEMGTLDTKCLQIQGKPHQAVDVLCDDS